MCWHKWTRWKLQETGHVLVKNQHQVGTYEYQRRECEKCGKAELRFIEAAFV